MRAILIYLGLMKAPGRTPAGERLKLGGWLVLVAVVVALATAGWLVLSLVVFVGGIVIFMGGALLRLWWRKKSSRR